LAAVFESRGFSGDLEDESAVGLDRDGWVGEDRPLKRATTGILTGIAAGILTGILNDTI
jgi:hypothetical protein